MTIAVEYVPVDDTLAAITIQQTTSASLRTTNAILIAGLLIASYFLNFLFIVAVLITKSFRTTIYLMYCHLTLINIFDLSFNILFALIFVANGNWTLSNGVCTFNVAAQQFVHLNTLFVLMLIGAERATGLILGPDYIINGHKYMSGRRVGFASFLLAFVSIAFASVVFTSDIPTKPFRNRYVCGIDGGGPIGYVLARLIIYFGCLVIILVAIGAILRKRSAASIPHNTQEYGEFIKKNRAMAEHKSRAKLMILITCVFIFIEGPYITLCFFYEMYNSRELVDVVMDIPQDADTLITWLKFVFPLLCPIIMLSWCNDVWLKVKEVTCCRSYSPPTIGHYMPPYRGIDVPPQVPSVMTIVGSDNGVRINQPTQAPRNTVQTIGDVPRVGATAPPLEPSRIQQPTKSEIRKRPTESKIPRRISIRPKRLTEE